MPPTAPETIKPDSQAAKLLPDNMESKACDWEIKALDDSGKLSIYMACFNNVDRGGDIIESGAFKNLDEYIRSGWLGINHEMQRLPIGYPISAVQDDKGLLCQFQFHSTDEAQACRTIVKERLNASKAVFGSIGYKVANGGSKQEFVGNQSIRRLTDVLLYEASVVCLPMNPKAEAVSAKSLSVPAPEEPATPKPEEGTGGNVEEKLISIDALKSMVDAMTMQTKAGRVLSKGNHAMLKGWHGTLSTMCSDMKALVDLHDPEKNKDKPDDDEEEGEPEDDKGIVSSPGSPVMAGDSATIDPRRAAGNSLKPDQATRGAVTAADMKADKEKRLRELRDRAVRAQLAFAMLTPRS